jgi:hypothetical protein
LARERKSYDPWKLSWEGIVYSAVALEEPKRHFVADVPADAPRIAKRRAQYIALALGEQRDNPFEKV